MYITCLTELSRFEDADEFINGLSKEVKGNSMIISAISLLELQKKNNQSGKSLEQLNISYSKNPNNVEVVLEIGEKYFAEKNIENAFDFLLKNYPKFKNNDKQKIKETLLKFFNVLGNDNDFTKKYRKVFSSIIFS